MKTNYMLEYNKLFDKIVKDFGIRFYKEAFNEEFDINDIDIIDYQGYKHILTICDEYYDLEDMIFTLEYNIPLKIVREYYNKSLEAHMEDKPFGINLYNYFRKTCYPQSYEAEDRESLEKSEENVKKAKEKLEKIIKGSK